MIYEWRTYTMMPGSTGTFLRLFKETALPIRTAYRGGLVAFWTPVDGRARTLHHLWRYPSLDIRAAVRKELAADKHWVSDFVQQVAPLIARQDVTFLSPIAGELSAIKASTHVRLQLTCVPFRTANVLRNINADEVVQFNHETSNPHTLTLLFGDSVELSDRLWQTTDNQRTAVEDDVAEARLERLRPLEFSPLR